MIRLRWISSRSNWTAAAALAAATSGASTVTEDFTLGAQQDDAPAALHPPASSLVLISGLSCRTMFNKISMDFEFSMYSIKPNLRNLFMKKLTRDRVVPIISASIS